MVIEPEIHKSYTVLVRTESTSLEEHFYRTVGSRPVSREHISFV